MREMRDKREMDKSIDGYIYIYREREILQSHLRILTLFVFEYKLHLPMSRLGDLPDTEISNRDVLLPLISLSINDPTIARTLLSCTLSSLWQSYLSLLSSSSSSSSRDSASKNSRKGANSKRNGKEKEKDDGSSDSEAASDLASVVASVLQQTLSQSSKYTSSFAACIFSIALEMHSTWPLVLDSPVVAQAR